MDYLTKSLAANVRRIIQSTIGTEDITADLKGACALASWALYTVLSAREPKHVRFVAGYYLTDEDVPHCWVEYHNLIIDLTATQFGKEFPDLFITSISNPNYVKLSEDAHAFEEVNRWGYGAPRNAPLSLRNAVDILTISAVYQQQGNAA